MKCIITGGSGFLGSHVADELTKKKHKVTIYDIKKSIWIKSNQRFIKGSILNFNKFKKACKNQDIIFHFASLSDLNSAWNDPVGTVNNNILGTVHALEIAKRFRVKRLIYASSIYVNSIEGGFYRSSKKAAEDYIQEYSKKYGLKFTILRYGSLYGDRADKSNGLRLIIKNAVKKNKIEYFGNKKTERRYINVKDAAKASAEILNKKYANKHLIITGSKQIKISKMLSYIYDQLSLKNKIIYKKKLIPGHYIKNPNTYKPNYGKKLNFKSDFTFEDELKKMMLHFKKGKFE
tara:strand:- start:69 stop:941 length:873 start_codon:yes stop_codon:yes gene_type:complete